MEGKFSTTVHSGRVFLAYFAQFLKSRLEYRGDFIAGLLANVIVTASGLLFIILLIDGEVINHLQSWTREEVLFIYGYSMIGMAIFSTFAPNLYRFGDRFVVQGQFDRVLLRPISSLGQVIFESFNLESFGSLIVGSTVIAWTAHELQMHFSFLDVLWLFVSSVSGGIILLSVFVFLASLSFHFEDRVGIAAPVFSLVTFGRYPLPIFNNALQFVLRWIVPFAFVAFYPATHFMNRPGFEFYCYFTPIMALLSATVASLAWKFGVARYSSTGN